MKKRFFFIIPVLILGIVWEIVAVNGLVNPSLFPPPTKVAHALIGLMRSGVLLSDLQTSVWRLIAGLALGSLLGVAVGLMTGRMNAVAVILTPIIQLIRPLPPVALIPLIIVWFGIGDGAKIISIAFAVFFPVWINTHIGAEQIPRIYLWRARLLSSSRIDTMTRVLLPASLPYLFKRLIFHASLPFIVAGVRIGIAFAFIMVFVSELAGASQGLGYRISVAHLSYRIDEMIAALVVLGALGALTDELFTKSIRRLYPWLALNGQ